MKTDEVPLNSSVHGKLRRSQRDISKRDLQAAIKYGKKTIQYRRVGNSFVTRWKIEYCNVTYITDEDMTTEVTCYAEELLLTEVVIPSRFREQYDESKRRLSDLTIITSHMVFIVDMSTSMNKSDMNAHKTRSHGVYYNIAEEYIAENLRPIASGLFDGKNTTFTDVITLIEMRDVPTVVFEREPITWILYNTIVVLANRNDTRNHGNYYRSLSKAFEILDDHSKLQPKCALGLFFFSDGRPSDHVLYDHNEFPENLYEIVRENCRRLAITAHNNGVKFLFKGFGFGKSNLEFVVMQQMLLWAKTFGCETEFGHSYTNDNSLGDILSSTATSLTESRTMLSRITHDSHHLPREKKDIQKEHHSVIDDFNEKNWTFYKRSQHNIINRCELEFHKEKHSGKFIPEWKYVDFLNEQAVGFAVGKKYFGEGAERIVFKMTEIDRYNKPVGIPLVAKESLYKEKRQDLMHQKRWHKTFVKTQMKAANLAKKFNDRLDRINVSKDIPRIKFLPCSVYECNEGAYLSETQLKPDLYVKWNNNAGAIDGIRKENKLNYEPMVMIEKKIEVIQEDEEDEDEDEESDVEYNDEVEELGNKIKTGLDFNRPTFASSEKIKVENELKKRILENDIPQAFTHFTYVFTKRDEMVCDLQGQLSLEQYPSVFLLTDPCIHSKHGTKYGRTDKGTHGMQLFFKTHQCNCVCKLMGFANPSYQDQNYYS
jgi:hypothetical protein